MLRWCVKILLVCLISICVSLGAATAPAITTQPANKTVTLGATATFTVVASGTAPLTYQWSKNSSTISGATSSSYTTPATVTNGAHHGHQCCRPHCDRNGHRHGYPELTAP